MHYWGPDQCKLRASNISKMNYMIQTSNRLELVNCQLQLAHQQTACTIVITMAQLLHNRRHPRRHQRKTVWVRPWLERRLQFGHYFRLLEELRIEDERSFRNFLRVDPRMFHELLQRLEHRISKQDTWYRKSIEPGLELANTLRYLASGDNYHSLMYAFRVAYYTVSNFIPEVSNNYWHFCINAIIYDVISCRVSY